MSDTSLISAVVIAIVAYVYITIIRPARRDQAKHQQQIRNLRIGDKVLTTSNFIAEVVDIQVLETGRSMLSLELAPGVVVKAMPGAIVEMLERAESNQPADEKGLST